MARLRADHAELGRLLEAARDARAVEQRAHLSAWAELLDRHVRWEERELFPYAEDHVDEASLARIGGELEKRLAVAKGEAKATRS
jgi:hemerythrin-like domain-containing protein